MINIHEESELLAVAQVSDEVLAHCASEPIHIPGAIQPHGFLLEVAPASGEILTYSDNASEFIKAATPPRRAPKLADIYPQAQTLLDSLRSQTANAPTAPTTSPPVASQPVASQRVRLPLVPCARLKTPYLCEAHYAENGNAVLEFEPFSSAETDGEVALRAAECSNWLHRAYETGGGMQAVLNAVTQRIRAFIDFDRVMVYQMDSEGHGAVVAESRRCDLPEYQGLHFPASDIPPQARKLYVKNRVRLLSNVNYSPIALVPTDPAATRPPLDLSMAHLRSVSPVHVEYLQNMGVTATLVISIVIEGKLWGLIACHHYSPKHLDARYRQACEQLGQTVAAMVHVEELRAIRSAVEQSKQLVDGLVDCIGTDAQWRGRLSENGPRLLELLRVDGLALLEDHTCRTIGHTPAEDVIRHIGTQWRAARPHRLRDTRNLSQTFEFSLTELDHIAGCAFIKISSQPFFAAVLFRDEVATCVQWGGDPRKHVDPSEPVARLSPRKSFEKWTQDVAGFAPPWDVLDRHAVAALANFLSTRKAEDGARHKELFFTNMSHELRTPMTSILGYADLLRDQLQAETSSAGAREAADTIHRNGEHLLGLINDVLDLSKIGSGELQFQIEPIHMHELFSDLHSLFDALASKKQVRLKCSADHAPAQFAADPLRLKQILINLVGNAVKFTPRGSVEVVAEELNDQPDMLRFTVRDSGIGIPPEVQPELFTPFYQGDLTTSRQFGGTGLGLTLSRELARGLGGDLQLIESTPATGSTFALVLPFARINPAKPSHHEQSSAAPSPPATAPHDSATTPHASAEPQPPCKQQPPRVLLVEDGPDNQRLIRFILQKAGMQVEVAENGLEAIQAIEHSQSLDTPFHIVLMDMQMPVMDGYTATQTLRARGSALPIIALTAHAMAGEKEKCLAAGCDAYLSKPVNRTELIKTIEQFAGVSA